MHNMVLIASKTNDMINMSMTACMQVMTITHMEPLQ